MRAVILATLVSLFLVNPSAAAAANGSSPTQQSLVNACGGALPFGQIVSCPSITEGEEHVFTVTTTRNADLLFITRTRGSGGFVSAGVRAPDGSFLCSISDTTECQLGRAGAYTIVLSLAFGETGDYTLAVESMRTPSSCTALPNSFFSFASPGISGTLPFGAAARCFRFNQPTGSVLHLVDPGAAQGMIRDGQFQTLCSVGNTNVCTLTQPGPYRLFLVDQSGAEAAYRLRMPRISQSDGCPGLRLAPFGDPADATATGTLARQGDVGCHKLRPAVAGAVLVRVDPAQDLGWTVYSDAGAVICTAFANARSCPLPSAGTYSLVTQNADFLGRPITYKVAVAALFRNGGCAAQTGTAWDVPTLLVHQTSGVQTNCQPFVAGAGDRVVAYRAPTVFNQVAAWFVDSAGTPLCQQPGEDVGCLLPAGGTYRVISYLWNWSPESTDETYKLQVRRLSNPAGCPTIQPADFGPPADAPGGIRCRILDLPTAGVHILKGVDADNFSTAFPYVFDTEGQRLNVCGTVACTFPAAGRYTVVLGGAETNRVIENDFAYTLVLLHPVPSASCVAVPDTGYEGAAHQGQFVAAGQHDCLQLPSPAGARVVDLLPAGATGPAAPTALVFDATGNFVCDTFSLRQFTCQLNGTAPFIAVLSSPSGEPTGSYAMAFARTDVPPACAVWPPDAMVTTVTTGADRYVACLSIPADQHAARESFRYTRIAGEGTAVLSVFNASGQRQCGPAFPATDRTLTCQLPPGPVTVILQAETVAATYQLTRTVVP